MIFLKNFLTFRLDMNANKRQLLCFKQDGAISILRGKPLKFVDKFTYFGSNISSIESNVNICLTKIVGCY